MKNLLHSLVIQLLPSQPALIPDPVIGLFSECMYGERQPSTSQVKSVLFELLSFLKRSYIIIDALDEVPLELREEGIFPFLTSLASLKNFGLHLMITSRRESDIQRYFQSMNHVPIDLSGLVMDDIRRHIDSFVARHHRLHQLRVMIKTSLLEKAHGM